MSNLRKDVIYQQGNAFMIDSEPAPYLTILPNGVYELRYNEMMGFCYLQKISEQFEFPYKVYNLESTFITYVQKTYLENNKNCGVLLNGLKGTGKTVTAQKLCNELNQPIIVVNVNYKQPMLNFFNKLKQQITVLFDEYDKTFGNEDSTLLSLMDGVHNNGFKKMFLLTSNENRVSNYMIERPSRIRYIKQFADLSIETIKEIVDDFLIYKEYTQDVIEFVSTLNIITVDIVKEVIKEVNIHNVKPEVFKSFFNVLNGKTLYNLYAIDLKGNKMLIKTSTDLNVKPKFVNRNVGTSFYIDYDSYNQEYLGEIDSVIDENTIKIELSNVTSKIPNFNLDGEFYLTLATEPVVKKHSSFSSSGYEFGRYVDMIFDITHNADKFTNILHFVENEKEEIVDDKLEALKGEDVEVDHVNSISHKLEAISESAG